MNTNPMMSTTDSVNTANNSQQQMMGQNHMTGVRGPHPGDADPRLRAAASARFRLGNPNSIANSMAGQMGGQGGPGGGGQAGMQSHPGMMGGQQRMPMGNNMMPGNMNMNNGQQGGMGPNMQMMNQQQVRY